MYLGPWSRNNPIRPEHGQAVNDSPEPGDSTSRRPWVYIWAAAASQPLLLLLTKIIISFMNQDEFVEALNSTGISVKPTELKTRKRLSALAVSW